MWKRRCSLFVLKPSYICYYIICMTAPLIFEEEMLELNCFIASKCLNFKPCFKFRWCCLRDLLWITNSSDHRSAVNPLHAMQLANPLNHYSNGTGIKFNYIIIIFFRSSFKYHWFWPLCQRVWLINVFVKD